MPPQFAHLIHFIECDDGSFQAAGWFSELSAARSAGALGANPISFAEIDAWSRLTGRDVFPIEVNLLRSIDATLLRVINEKNDD